MNFFFSALGVVTGTVFFAISGYGVIVPALFCLTISVLAFTTMTKYRIEIMSLLAMFLLMFLSFGLRQEYFQYFAINQIKEANTVFKVVEVKETAFFKENLIIKPHTQNPIKSYFSPKLIWRISNIKALKKNDLISFDEELKIKEISKRKIHLTRSKKIFHELKNEAFNYIGRKKDFITSAQESITHFYRDHLKKDNAELALGLVLGSRNASMERDTISSIRNLGLGHFFSASGFHLITLLMIVIWFCRRAKLESLIQVPISISAVIAYMALTNFTPSILRAGIMAIVFLIFQNSSRKINGPKLLLFLAAIVLLVDPYTAFDIGFQFSYLATMGILFWYKDINSKLEEYIGLNWLREVIALTLSVQIFIYPLVIYYFSNAQIWSFLANIIFTPILGLVTVLCFTGIYFLIDPILSLLNLVFNASKNLPFIDHHFDLTETSLVLFYVLLISLAFYSLKSYETKENILLNILKSKHIQLALAASALVMFLGTNLKPINVTELRIKDAVINEKEYKDIFKTKEPYKYFKIEGYQALLINKLDSIKTIEKDIREVNLLFIPNLNSKFIYLAKLEETFDPQIIIVDSRSKSKKTLKNLELLASSGHNNTLFGSGKLNISQDKFWSISY